MPKRQKQSFKHLQGSSSNSVGNKSATTQDAAAQRSNASVNERLNELRKIESPEAAQRKKALAESANQRSIPPALRGILGVPDAVPPKPKILRMRERMRTPGPLAPRSWLYGSSTTSDLETRLKARRKARKVSERQSNPRPRPPLLRFRHLVGRHEGKGENGPASLRHTALRATAIHWDLFDEDDYPLLTDLPISLRLDLLSYIAHYGPQIDTTTVEALIAGTEALSFLDLGGLCGSHDFSLQRLARLAHRKHPQAADTASDRVLDSWEDEEPSLTSLSLQPPSPFASLTQLSLSHPVQAGWKGLIAFSKHVPQLTHLSLAYWHRPTLTPNLTTSTVEFLRGLEVNAGGTSYYSSLDEEYTEPIALLRQLSGNLLRLKWLDLEGCADWAGALAQTTTPTAHLADFNQIQPRTDAEISPAVSILTTTWKEITYLNLSQGWFPTLPGVSSVDRQGSARLDEFTTDLVEHLQEYERRCENSSVDSVDDKRRAAIWKQTQYRLFRMGRKIHNLRRTAGCKLIDIDFGYKTPQLWKYLS
ncbi:hypothetical protein K431DRAFT_227083 [Polychaeton citri CBS 116435]|uniref:RNI-like protein n=1 Tax=Polychaeton citri CBS 116435 TaxID=1314669 RepID=A0A9P4UN20_9PEZI|nr:hypothetical protein K431DRAFT_227083 [Polychaeton citri CBS 116435]